MLFLIPCKFARLFFLCWLTFFCDVYNKTIYHNKIKVGKALAIFCDKFRNICWLRQLSINCMRVGIEDLQKLHANNALSSAPKLPVIREPCGTNTVLLLTLFHFQITAHFQRKRENENLSHSDFYLYF